MDSIEEIRKVIREVIKNMAFNKIKGGSVNNTPPVKQKVDMSDDELDEIIFGPKNNPLLKKNLTLTESVKLKINSSDIKDFEKDIKEKNDLSGYNINWDKFKTSGKDYPLKFFKDQNGFLNVKASGKIQLPSNKVLKFEMSTNYIHFSPSIKDDSNKDVWESLEAFQKDVFGQKWKAILTSSSSDLDGSEAAEAI